jgi:hypothetical protein
MVDRKDRFALLGRFERLCKEHGYPKPMLNKNVEQWAADALLESYGLQECYDLLAYYFKINPRPTWKKFSYGAGDLREAKIAKEQDDAFRAEMREKVKEWLT